MKENEVNPSIRLAFFGVGGQDHCPIECRYSSGFLVLSVQVFCTDCRKEQEHKPITV